MIFRRPGFRPWSPFFCGPSYRYPEFERKCIFLQKSFALLFFRRIFAVPNEGTRGVAQLASASGLGPEGPVFESQYPDIQAKKLTENQ